MLKNIFVVAFLITALVLSPILANEMVFAEKKEKDKTKPIKCQVKVQVKVVNAVNGTIYLAELGNLSAQAKTAEEPTVTFNFQYKKGGLACPDKNESVIGSVNGEQFSVLIKSLTKPNKVVVELP